MRIASFVLVLRRACGDVTPLMARIASERSRDIVRVGMHIRNLEMSDPEITSAAAREDAIDKVRIANSCASLAEHMQERNYLYEAAFQLKRAVYTKSAPCPQSTDVPSSVAHTPPQKARTSKSLNMTLPHSSIWACVSQK
jgi:hypothetical protein